MLRQKCSYGKDIESHKKLNRKEKVKLKFSM